MDPSALIMNTWGAPPRSEVNAIFARSETRLATDRRLIDGQLLRRFARVLLVDLGIAVLATGESKEISIGDKAGVMFSPAMETNVQRLPVASSKMSMS